MFAENQGKKSSKKSRKFEEFSIKDAGCSCEEAVRMINQAID